MFLCYVKLITVCIVLHCILSQTLFCQFSQLAKLRNKQKFVWEKGSKSTLHGTCHSASLDSSILRHCWEQESRQTGERRWEAYTTQARTTLAWTQYTLGPGDSNKPCLQKNSGVTKRTSCRGPAADNYLIFSY